MAVQSIDGVKGWSGSDRMRPAMADFKGLDVDVCVIGAGVNGASSAQHLAAAGYTVALVEKGDYGSGSSSRSTRLQHCGLRYLAPGASIFEFVLHPSRLRTAMRMAKLGMEARRQMVLTAPERVRPLNFHFPMWKTSTYKPWQVRVALGLLASFAEADVPLDQKIISPRAAKAVPLVNGLRDWDQLKAIGAFTEYQFDWPERVCVDAVLDAARLGAKVRNYTAVTSMKREGDAWVIGLADVKTNETASIRAKFVLNMAGIWVDKVNAASGQAASRKILGTKGIHIMVRLPPECANNGIVTFNSRNEPLYCIPWRGMHYFGPTETVYEGNLDDIRAEEAEIEDLRTEANILLPGLKLKHEDILFTWAGVRPLTYDPALPMGKRSRDVHDLSGDGLPNVFAMTAGPVMSHRSAGTQMVELVRERMKPGRPAQAVDYGARRFPDNQNSPPIVPDWTEAKLADLAFAAQNEHATDLVDLMFRRVGVGWSSTMGFAAAEAAARAVAPVLGWDEARAKREAQAYREYLKRMHTVRAA